MKENESQFLSFFNSFQYLDVKSKRAHMTYDNKVRSVLRSPTNCLVFELTLCHIGSSCCLIIASKDLNNAFSTERSSMSI